MGAWGLGAGAPQVPENSLDGTFRLNVELVMLSGARCRPNAENSLNGSLVEGTGGSGPSLPRGAGGLRFPVLRSGREI